MYNLVPLYEPPILTSFPLCKETADAVVADPAVVAYAQDPDDVIYPLSLVKELTAVGRPLTLAQATEPAEPAEPVMFIPQVPEAFVPEVDGAPTSEYVNP